MQGSAALCRIIGGTMQEQQAQRQALGRRKKGGGKRTDYEMEILSTDTQC